MPDWLLPLMMGTSQISQMIYGNQAANTARQASELQANANEFATRLQNQATNRALDIQENQFAQTQNMMRPYADTGKAALAKLNEMMGLNVTPSEPYQAQTGSNSFNTGAPVQAFNPGGSPEFPSPSGWQQAAQYGLAAAPTLGMLMGSGGGAAAGPISGSIGAMATGGKGAVAGGGMLSSLGSLAANPLFWGPAAALGGGLAWKATQAHHKADDIVKGRDGAAGQEDFDAFLAKVGQAVDSGQISVGNGIQLIEQGWQDYQDTNRQWAGDSGRRNTVMDQSFNTLAPQVQGLANDWRSAIQNQGGGQDFTVGQNIQSAAGAPPPPGADVPPAPAPPATLNQMMQNPMHDRFRQAAAYFRGGA